MSKLSRSRCVLVSFTFALIVLCACASNPPPTITLNPGNYTPLGGVQKNNNPTASDFAALQAAEDGTPGKPAFVEFYADYWLICKSIQPAVSGLTQRYQDKVQFIHINIDSPDAQPALKRYNVRGTPTIVLLDRHGHIASNVPGWSGDQAVAKALDTLAAEP